MYENAFYLFLLAFYGQHFFFFDFYYEKDQFKKIDFPVYPNPVN